MIKKSEQRIAVYTGGYVYKIGTPFLLVAAYETDRDGAVGLGDYFVFIIDKTGQSISLAHANQVEVARGDESPQYTIPDLSEWAEEEATDLAKGEIMRRQFEVSATDSVEAALKQCEFRREEDWKMFLMRMRYRGLPENVLMKVASMTSVKPLQEYLRFLTSKRPMTVRNLT